MPNRGNDMMQSLEAIVQLAMTLVGTYVAAIWLCLIVWTVRDIRKRTDDIVVVVLSTLLVLLFNLPGWFLYLILRPPELLADLRIRQLQSDILGREVSSYTVCSQCEHPVESDFRVCPSCGVTLKQGCSSCGRLIRSAWRVCPFCATSKHIDEVPLPISRETGNAEMETAAIQRTNGSVTTGKIPAIERAYTLSGNPAPPIIRSGVEN